MNSDARIALALRQQRLMQRSADLRGQIGSDVQRWQAPLARIDEARRLYNQALNWVRRHPEVPAGLAIGVAVLRPRRTLRLAWRWGRRGWFGWQLYRRALAAGLVTKR